MTAADALRRFLDHDSDWPEVEPRVWKRTLSQGYALEVRDTAAGWLAHLRREGSPPPSSSARCPASPTWKR